MIKKDNEIKSYALQLWARYLEAGTSSDKIFNCNWKEDLNKQKFIVRLKKMAEKELIINS